MADTPTTRTLAVYRAVAHSGPVVLNDLQNILPQLSRMGIWRALNNLRDAGWVRLRLGDNAWLITHATQDMLNDACLPPRAVEELSARLPQITRKQTLILCAFTERGRLEIVESTDKSLMGEVLPLIGEPAAFAALGISTEADMLRHLNAWISSTADAEERALVKSGGLTQGLRAARQNPALKTAQGYAIPYRAADDSIAVAWIETRAT
ncbi:hypothetical protein [Leisingera sp. S232]|uniref:hypothetical protein n=1 Tax=Leisingera sp. S232 TaxID=3415132 RepID=UPI003C7D9459